MAKAVIGKKPKPKIQKTDKAQSDRFKETARKLGASEREEDFDSTFRKIVSPRRPTLRDRS